MLSSRSARLAHRQFANACLNRQCFTTIVEARAEIAARQDHYNHVRSHNSLNYLPPV
ncbi:integrase core domain-containing protein [Halomonas sp. HMF6819]|uniref:integrase core domain-containing protein n=1 Tax=Halomonas sp. HMF6819 TaxID=3373085 RepID=UPI0037AE9CDE